MKEASDRGVEAGSASGGDFLAHDETGHDARAEGRGEGGRHSSTIRLPT